MTLPQSDTIQLTCSRHHFNHAPLDWMDRKTQTRVTRGYSPLIFNLRRTVAADIALPINAVTIDVTLEEVALRFRLGNRLRAFGQLSMWFRIVSINVKLQNDERRRKGQHL